METLIFANSFRDGFRWVLSQFIKDIKVVGMRQIPTQGPVLIVSNHPGTVDSIAIVSALPRDDIKIISGFTPFTNKLPNTRNHLIYTNQDTFTRMSVLRATIRHLEKGGCLLTFPGGRIDPDPAISQDLAKNNNHWSKSIALIIKRVPQTRLIITTISHVLLIRFMNHPLARIRRNYAERQRVAEMLQIICHY
jgi:1-acyl-sn-glycerol-3-phosphate acyltransferase